MARALATLPKAHLHLHFTGSMRHPTLIELARERGVHLPEALAAAWPPRLRGTDERGWFRFQRLYDIARSVLTDEPAVFRLLRESAEDERADGSGWLEIQVDPSGYGSRFGGLTPTVELVLAAARAASAATGVGIGVIIAANLQSHATSNVCNVAQAAALTAVTGDLSAVAEMRAAFDRRRLAMTTMLNDIPGVICPLPEGAFYCYPSVKGVLGKEFAGSRPASSAELAEVILDHADVAVVPGEAFGTPGYFRLSCALGDADLEEGITRLGKLLAQAR